MDIKCRKITCDYNDCTTCMANEISISNELKCKTFSTKNNKKVTKPKKTKNMFEFGEDYTMFKNGNTKEIKCNAVDCLFNAKCHCTANGINVLCGENCGLCGTHINK